MRLMSARPMRIDERNRRVQITRTESRVRTKKTQRRTFHTRSFELLLPQQPTCMIFLHATLSLSLSLSFSFSLLIFFSLSSSQCRTCNPLFNRIVARSIRDIILGWSIELSGCGQTVSRGARCDYARFPTIIASRRRI